MPDNQQTIDYMRYAIGEFLKTYPQVDGIGVTAGEHVNKERVKNVGGIEQWLWQTYGQAVMDAKRAQPGRELRFIFRQHQANLGKIAAAFQEFDGPFHTGHKYARARLYCTTTSPRLDMEYRKHLEEHKVPCWLNLRNDDLFVFRWGDADYVREFLQNVPRDYIEKRLAHRFPEAHTKRLYDTWAAASQIVPQVNHFFWRENDFQFAPEACNYNKGFLPVDQFFEHGPLTGAGILSVQQYAAAVNENKAFDGITPMEVADKLDTLANQILSGLITLTCAGTKQSKELNATLVDMEAMAYLGRYYADKIRGAAALAVFRANREQTAYHQQAVQHLTNAVPEWEAYARLSTKHYRPQLFSRTHYLDWWALLDDVKQEVEAVRKEGP